MVQTKIYIYGKHAVGEALRHAPQVLRKIHLGPQMDDRGLKSLIKQSGIPTEPLDQQKVSSQVERNAPHQGIVALISLGDLTVPFERFADTFEPTAETCLVFANEVQDPHNLGTMIRSAVAFGASAVLIPTHNQAPITGVVIKASVGMAFRIPIILVENTQQAIAQLKKKGVKVYGLAGESTSSIAEQPFDAPTMFVLGNEGQGISPAARALCDKILSISISPRAESLNVSASSAIALYAWSSQHPKALKSQK